MMKCLRLLALALVITVLPVRALYAADVEYGIKSQYTLNKNTVSVAHEFSLTADSELGKQTIQVPGTSDKFNIANGTETVSYEDKPTTGSIRGIQFKATDLVIDLGSKKQADLTISYESSDLFADYVKAKSLFAPPFTLDNVTSQEVVLSAEMELAIGNIIGEEARDISTDGGQQVYTFSTSGAFDEPIILQMGSIANAEVEVGAKLTNDGFWWKTKSLVLPLDTNQQKSFVQSIEPKPSSVRVDRDGNIVANYFLAPKQSINVKAKVNVLLEQKSYDLESDGGFEQLDMEIVADYTGNTALWPESVLGDLGLNKGDLRSGSVIEAIEEVNDALGKQKIELTNKVNLSERIGKESRKQQSSLDIADKAVSALRATGVPARIVGGVITDTQLTRLDESQLHVWVEAFVPGEGWLTIDPMLNRLGENFFGQSGLQRVALFIWGVNDHIPEFSNEEVTVKYTNKDQPDEEFGNNNVSGTNYVLLPGISLLHTSVQMPSGYIHDEVNIKANDSVNQLGSLAPLQKTNSLQLLIGDKSWQEIPLSLQIAGANKAKSTASVSFLSTVVVVVILLLLIHLMIKWYKKSKAPLVINEDEVHTDDIQSHNMLHLQTQPDNSEQRDYGSTQDVPQAQSQNADDDRLRTRRPPNRINF